MSWWNICEQSRIFRGLKFHTAGSIGDLEWPRMAKHLFNPDLGTDSFYKITNQSQKFFMHIRKIHFQLTPSFSILVLSPNIASLLLCASLLLISICAASFCCTLSSSGWSIVFKIYIFSILYSFKLSTWIFSFTFPPS